MLQAKAARLDASRGPDRPGQELEEAQRKERELRHRQVRTSVGSKLHKTHLPSNVRQVCDTLIAVSVCFLSGQDKSSKKHGAQEGS